jgi:hypothetical protein
MYDNFLKAIWKLKFLGPHTWTSKGRVVIGWDPFPSLYKQDNVIIFILYHYGASLTCMFYVFRYQSDGPVDFGCVNNSIFQLSSIFFGITCSVVNSVPLSKREKPWQIFFHDDLVFCTDFELS